MNRRLVALLLALVLGLQSLLAPAASPAAGEHATQQEHCVEMSAAHVVDTTEQAPSTPGPAHGDDCPCCLGMAAGCMTTCLIAAAGTSHPLAFAPDLRDDRVTASQLPILDRLDIPPTPPPIG